MVDLLVPVAQKIPLGGGRTLLRRVLPPHLGRRVVTLNHRSQIADLSQLVGGRGVKPKQAVSLTSPDGRTILIAGMGAAEAAEIEDVAQAAMEKAEAKPMADRIAEWRERRGLPSREEFDVKFREAIEDKIQHHRRHSRTDPFRGQKKTRVTVTMPDQPWKREEPR